MAEKLKYAYDTADDVPEAHRALYEERDGKMVLGGVEGLVDKKRLDEFRTSNIRLSQQIEDIQRRFEGIDPEEVKTLRSKVAEWADKQQEIEDQKLLDEKNIEEIRRQATKKIAEERDKGFQDRDKQIEAMQSQLHKLLVTDRLRQAAVSKRLNDWAVGDAVALGAQTISLNEHGDPAIYEQRDGQRQLRYNQDGEPMTVEQWLDEQIATRPGWLPPSSGGGTHHQATPTNGRAPSTTKPVGQWTTAEKVAFGTKHGWDAWEKKILESQTSPS